MNKLRAIMAYFCSNHSPQSELSKARLTKLVYLADWYSALVDNEKMTDIDWVFNHHGPNMDDATELTHLENDFSVMIQKTIYGADKYIISYSGHAVDQHFSENELNILDTIIRKTQSLYFNELVDFVYSTYPVSSNERCSKLDLLSLAGQYKAEQYKSVHV